MQSSCACRFSYELGANKALIIALNRARCLLIDGGYLSIVAFNGQRVSKVTTIVLMKLEPLSVFGGSSSDSEELF